MFYEINIPPKHVLIIITCDFIIGNLSFYSNFIRNRLCSIYSVGKEVERGTEKERILSRDLRDL